MQPEPMQPERMQPEPMQPEPMQPEQLQPQQQQPQRQQPEQLQPQQQQPQQAFHLHQVPPMPPGQPSALYVPGAAIQAGTANPAPPVQHAPNGVVPAGVASEPAPPAAVAPEPAPPAVVAPETAAPAAVTAAATNSPLSMSSLRLAAVALLVCAGAFVGMSELGIGRNGSGTAVDTGVLAVVASDLVTASKVDSGASDAIGGYLPGVGIVLTAHIDELAAKDMESWVAGNLDPFADRLALLPDGEAVVVTLDIAGPAAMARVWSLQPSDIERTEGWERLVAPATFVDSQGEVDATASEPPPSSLASVEDQTPTGDDEPSADDPDAADGEDATDEEMDDGAAADDGDLNDGEPVEAASDDVAIDDDAGDGNVALDGGGDGGVALAGAGSDGGLFGDAALWSPIFGSWTLVDGVYAQSDATGYGYSSEYMGDTPEQFDVGVTMRAPFGDMNAGIIYGQPDKGSKNGSTVIDITGEGTYLRWGEYDPDNGEWTFVGGAPIDPPIVSDEWTRLDLEVRGDKTAINLNDEFVASIDSPAPGGVALVVSVANIEFTDFTLVSVDGDGDGGDDSAAPDGSDAEADADEEADLDNDLVAGDGGDDEIETADGSGLEIDVDGGGVGGGGSGIAFEVIDDELVDWQLLSGSWTGAEGVMSQNNADGYDQMIHFLDEPEENYRVEVKARASEGSRFSGGLLFNVDRTGVRSNSFVFDIVNDGTDVRWATYDPNGVFTYLGGVRIADGFDPEQWHLLAVEVRDGRAQFFIDGSEVGASRDIGTSGHVGMVTSLASMDFTDFVVIPLDA